MRFILIDEIVDMTPGASIHGRKTLAADEDIFRDHFPGFPVVPGVLLTEMMAQTAGKCLDAADPARGKSMLIQVRQASFRKWVRPDERLDIHAEITSSTPMSAAARCRVMRGSEQVASADLLYAFVPHAQFSSGYRDPILEAYARRVRQPPQP